MVLGGFVIGDDIGGCGSDDENSGKNSGGQQHDWCRTTSATGGAGPKTEKKRRRPSTGMNGVRGGGRRLKTTVRDRAHAIGVLI
jgi:hypothetical protein